MKISLRLTFEQQMRIDRELLGLRLVVAEAVHGRAFVPKGRCPGCGLALTTLQILAGFSEDTDDLTTFCPACGTRFAPRLQHGNAAGWTEVPFYCAVQTLDRLPSLLEVPLEKFQAEHPALYNSAVVHFGGLRQAFRQIGLDYAFEQAPRWDEIAGPFLGKLPDGLLADILCTSVRKIRMLRRARRIAPYNARARAKALEAEET